MNKALENILPAAANGLFPLTLNQKSMLGPYLCSTSSWLSAYALPSLFLWRDFYSYYWTQVDDHLCVFAEHGGNYYMPLPPLGNGFSEQAVRKSTSLMRQVNSNPIVARIENIDEGAVGLFREMGFSVSLKTHEYLYRRKSLAGLHGDRYKSKRWAINHFLKSYSPSFDPYRDEDGPECLELFNHWQAMRRERYADSYYRALLDDAAFAHRRAVENFRDLNLLGWVVRIQDQIKGYAFGFELRPQVFCILLEVTDLAVKGLSQFLFWRFCQELGEYTFINALDDSGLENLKIVKESYHPERLLPSFTAYLT